jgi:hypothetical protein
MKSKDATIKIKGKVVNYTIKAKTYDLFVYVLYLMEDINTSVWSMKYEKFRYDN